jgi:lipid-A-disaccharide synthase-like uncharacterized protein
MSSALLAAPLNVVRFLESFLHPFAVLGFLGQAIFAGRFLVQWYVSEKRRESVVPKAFWYLSLVGSVFLLVYAVLKPEPVIFVGQVPGVVVYVRNLVLLARSGSRISPST